MCPKEHPRHPRSWSRSRHAPPYGYRRSGFGIVSRRGGSLCRFLYALPFPSVPPASRPGRLRRAVGRDSRGAERCAASRRRSRWTPDLSRVRPCRLRRTVAALAIDAQPPGATEPGRATLSPPSPPAPRNRCFRLRPSDPPHGTLVETRRRQPGGPLARPRDWARPPPADPKTDRPRSGNAFRIEDQPSPRSRTARRSAKPVSWDPLATSENAPHRSGSSRDARGVTFRPASSSPLGTRFPCRPPSEEGAWRRSAGSTWAKP
jgi:hypothetical protein